MGIYCANYYADPHCYNKVAKFGEFCTSCIESRRGWSAEVLDERVEPTQNRDRTADDIKATQKDTNQRDGGQLRGTVVQT